MVARYVARNFLNPKDVHGLPKFFSEWPKYSELKSDFHQGIQLCLVEQVNIVWAPKFNFISPLDKSHHEKKIIYGLKQVFGVFYQNRRSNALRKNEYAKLHFGGTPKEQAVYTAQLSQLTAVAQSSVQSSCPEGSYSVHTYQNLSLHVFRR